jgi:hypothetical protein
MMAFARLSGLQAAFAACSVVAFFCGCTTTMDGRPANAGSSGVRYYLPAPHVYMEPQSDGSVKLEVKYLPDPNNAYTLNVNAYFSTATFDVKTKDGMLTSVALNSDSSAVAVKAIEAATDLRKQKMTAEQKQEETRKAQESSKRVATKSAAEAVTAQREKVELLEAKLLFLKSKPGALPAAEQLELELEISQEKLKLAQLEQRLGLVRSAPSAEFNDPGAARANNGGSTAFGPVLFRVLPHGAGVKLVALDAQRPFPADGQAQAVASPHLDWSPKQVKIGVADAQRDTVIRFTEPVSLDMARSSLRRPADGVTAVPAIAGPQLSALVEGTVVTVKLPASLAKGAYRLDLTVKPASGEPKLVSIAISWLES